MLITREVPVPVNEPVEMFCNKCGCSCRAPGPEDELPDFNCVEQKIFYKPGSNGLFEGVDSEDAHICHKCYLEYQATWLHQPVNVDAEGNHRYAGSDGNWRQVTEPQT